jgi:hypothetical protein
VPAAHDQQPVQALGPHRPGPALGVGVGCRHRRDQHLGVLRAEPVVNPAAELRVTIANKDADPASSFLKDTQQVAGRLGDPPTVGTSGGPGQVDPAGVQLDQAQHYSRRSQTVSTVKQSPAMILAARWRRNVRHVLVVLRGRQSVR